MTTKKKLKRQVKRPKKFDDHVVEGMSQNRVELSDEDIESQVRADLGINELQFGDNENVTDKGVFGNENNSENVHVTPKVGTDTSGNKEVIVVDSATSSNNGIIDGLVKSAMNPVSPNVSPLDCNKTANVEVNNENNSETPKAHTPNTNSIPNANMSYASVVNNNVEKDDNKLDFKPTVLNEDGTEFVIFDEELVTKGCVKWNSTVCGYFVGCRMSVNELNYHLRRMWSKYGLTDVKMNASGECFFKFKKEEGMQEVLRLGPWMVNNRPFFVQKWDPIMGMEIKEMSKIPIWAKLSNVPLEAWSKEGISARASSLGTPLIMDSMTTQMCKTGLGKVEYARVLVEFDVNKGFKDKIHIQYTSKDNVVKGTKTVNVEYMWKPDICSHCVVFGHSTKDCGKRPKTEIEIGEEKRKNEKKKTSANEFMEVYYNRRGGRRVYNGDKRYQEGHNNGADRNANVWKKKNVSNIEQNKAAESNIGQSKPTEKKENQNGRLYTLSKEKFNAMKQTANQYAVLSDMEGEESKPQSITQRENKNRFDVLGSEGSNETLDTNVNQECQDEGDVCRDKNGKSSSMLEDIVRDKEVDDFFTRLQKEDEMVGMFVDNKRIPTVEESKQWAEYMFGWYKEK